MKMVNQERIVTLISNTIKTAGRDKRDITNRLKIIAEQIKSINIERRSSDRRELFIIEDTFKVIDALNDLNKYLFDQMKKERLTNEIIGQLAYQLSLSEKAMDSFNDIVRRRFDIPEDISVKMGLFNIDSKIRLKILEKVESAN